MFAHCYSLISFDLSSFDTSNVQTMKYLFLNCYSLKEIDLSNFDTTSLTIAGYMFGNCIKMEYINFKKYNEVQNEALSVSYIFDYILDNIVICISEDNNNTVNKIKTEIGKKNCSIIDCSENWKLQKKKIIKENNSCVDNCSDFKYEYNHKCYSTCPEGADFCQNENITTEYIYSTNIAITTNNIDRNNSYLQTDIDNSKNYIFTSSSLSHINKKDFDLYNITGETNEEIYQTIIDEAIKEFLFLKEDDIIIEGKDDFFFEITTSENEKEKNMTHKLSKIGLGECENILKGHYQVNMNNSLIIIKFEKITNISIERSIQYELYEPIDITKLNLSICDNMTINIYTPVVLSDG